MASPQGETAKLTAQIRRLVDARDIVFFVSSCGQEGPFPSHPPPFLLPRAEDVRHFSRHTRKPHDTVNDN